MGAGEAALAVKLGQLVDITEVVRSPSQLCAYFSTRTSCSEIVYPDNSHIKIWEEVLCEDVTFKFCGKLYSKNSVLRIWKEKDLNNA